MSTISCPWCGEAVLVGYFENHICKRNLENAWSINRESTPEEMGNLSRAHDNPFHVSNEDSENDSSNNTCLAADPNVYPDQSFSQPSCSYLREDKQQSLNVGLSLRGMQRNLLNVEQASIQGMSRFEFDLHDESIQNFVEENRPFNFYLDNNKTIKGIKDSHEAIQTEKNPLDPEDDARTFSDPQEFNSNRIDSGTNTTVLIRKNKAKKRLWCPACGKKYNKKRNLDKHMRIHADFKKYKCDNCKESFAHKTDLESHLLIPTCKERFECETCKKSFASKYYLQAHKLCHTIGKPYKCEKCGNLFTLKSHLKSHLQIHASEKPFKCKICKKSFIQRSKLIHHMQKHTGKKPYQCEKCKMLFSQISELESHMLSHTRKKSYQCPTCQKSFTRTRKLEAHMKSHEPSEKPFKCVSCGKYFSLKTTLTRHRNQNCRAKPSGKEPG